MKYKFIKLSAISLASFGLALFVFAQDATISPSHMPNREEIKQGREEMRKEKKENKEEKKEMRKDAKEEMKEKKETMKQEMKSRKEELKQNMEEKREELKQRLEHKREELKDKIEVKREELKEHLKTIKDERKKQVVEKIDKSLDALNDKMTKHFLNVLEKLEDILARISERTDKAENNGIDVSSVDTAITSAQAAIDSAKTAVETQAGKTYTLTIGIEDKLRVDVEKARKALHADLKTVYEIVKKARDAVHEAARAFAKAHGRDLPQSSPTISPSPTVLPSPIP